MNSILCERKRSMMKNRCAIAHYCLLHYACIILLALMKQNVIAAHVGSIKSSAENAKVAAHIVVGK